MLTEIADEVFVRQSEFCLSNAIVVRGDGGLLVVDPGVSRADIEELAADLAQLNAQVVVGFATHPHWDHLLWHPALGAAPRYATPRCIEVSDVHLADARQKAAPHGAPTELLGELTRLPGNTIPWDGPDVRVFQHEGHAPGHAAVLIAAVNVVLVGDMLSDVEVPLLDLETGDPLGDYDHALDVLEVVASNATTLVPGHGSVALGRDEIAARIATDRHYVEALHHNTDPDDARVGPDATYGRDWLPQTHARQLEHVRASGGRHR